jgi:hypothetical protein
MPACQATIAQDCINGGSITPDLYTLNLQVFSGAN